MARAAVTRRALFASRPHSPLAACGRKLALLRRALSLGVLLSCGVARAAPAPATSTPTSWPAVAPAVAIPAWPLHTRGRYILDQTGKRFKLQSVNWYGASDMFLVPGGLDKVPLSELVTTIRRLGFNSVRLPFANVMLHTAQVATSAVAANPQLFGKTPLAVFDAVVAELTSQGVAVVLNNHTTHAMWCCSYDDDGLWYTKDYSTAQWVDDWTLLAERYRDNPGVIAADLRNEVRIAKLDGTILPNPPSWGHEPNDWRAAAELAGNRVLEVNPNLLIVVEGINFPRDHLRGVFTSPVRLAVPDRLVYSAHNYGYIGPQLTGQTYGAMDYSTLATLLGQEWGFVTTENQAYTAPVWVSEFGDAFDQASDHRQWLTNITRYLAESDFDFAYWALNPGPKPAGDAETFSLLAGDWRTPLVDWRTPHLASLFQVHRGPGYEPNYAADPAHHFEAQIFSDWDTNRATDQTDWLSGSYKATCRDGSRLVGISVGQREGQSFGHEALCSDFGTVLAAGERQILKNDDGDQGAVGTHTQGSDWSPGANKLECGDGEYMAGIAEEHSLFGYRITGILCLAGQVTVGSGCYTESFAAGDARRTGIPGDWDPNQFKGQCALNDYSAGLSLRSGQVGSLLCCPLGQRGAASG